MTWKAVPREREDVSEAAKVEELPYPDAITPKGPRPSVGHEAPAKSERSKRSGKA